MKIELEFAQLQTPLFFKGINIGVKLPKADHRNTMILEWDTEKDKLYVWYKGSVAVIPMGNVASAVPKRAEDVGLVEPIIMPPTPKPAAPTLVKGKIKAQVSTPTSHVFDPKV